MRLWVLAAVSLSAAGSGPAPFESQIDELISAYFRNQESGKVPQHTLVCFPVAKSLCTVRDGCSLKAPAVYLLFAGRGNGEWVYRCDKGSCDKFQVDATISGVFVNYSLKGGGGYLLKRSLLDSTFVEAASAGMDLHVMQGLCKTSP